MAASTRVKDPGKAVSYEQLEREATKILGPESDPRIKFWLPTGITLLDMAISAGIPGGRITEIYGKESSGKTLLALCIARSAISRGGQVLWMDAEARFSVNLARELVKANISERFAYRIPDNLEKALDAFETWGVLARHNKVPTVIVLDSLAALAVEDQSIDSKKLEDANQKMSVASTLANFFRRGIIRKIAGSNVHFVFLNQIRDNVQFGWSGHGPKEPITPGGKAMAFYASTRIVVSQQTLRLVDKDVGTMLQFHVKKNSAGPPNRVVQCPFYFVGNLRGVRNEISLLNFLINKKILKKKKDKNGKEMGVFVIDGEETRKMDLMKRMAADKGFRERIFALVRSNW